MSVSEKFTDQSGIKPRICRLLVGCSTKWAVEWIDVLPVKSLVIALFDIFWSFDLLFPGLSKNVLYWLLTSLKAKRRKMDVKTSEIDNQGVKDSEESHFAINLLIVIKLSCTYVKVKT